MIMQEPPNHTYIMENEFFDYLNYVLLDYDDEKCQAQLRMIAAQLESAKNEKQLD
jgi:hypothetical protein